MKEGDFLCVNLEKHDKVQQFTCEQVMREHWQTCHDISLEEIMLPMVVPVLIREHARPNIRELGPGSGSGNPGPGGPPGGVTGSGGDAGLGRGSGNPNYGIGSGNPNYGIGRGSGNPGPGGPPVGTTGSGGDAGPVPDQGQGLSGAVSSLVKGTDSNSGAGPSETEGVLVKSLVKGTDPNSQPKGRGRRSALSKDGLKEISLLYGKGNPIRDVPVKDKAGRDNSTKKTSKEKPGKGKPAADPSATNTGSKGKPVFVSGVKPTEHKADSNDNEVEDEVAKAFLTEQKK